MSSNLTSHLPCETTVPACRHLNSNLDTSPLATLCLHSALASSVWAICRQEKQTSEERRSSAVCKPFILYCSKRRTITLHNRRALAMNSSWASNVSRHSAKRRHNSAVRWDQFCSAFCLFHAFSQTSHVEICSVFGRTHKNSITWIYILSLGGQFSCATFAWGISALKYESEMCDVTLVELQSGRFRTFLKPI